MLFTLSAVPAENQLLLPFLSLVTEAELHRNPTVKSEMEASGHALTGLLLTYPVHQACDILFCKAIVVPIGKDNLPHVEITRTIARRFNERYAKKTPAFPEPATDSRPNGSTSTADLSRSSNTPTRSAAKKAKPCAKTSNRSN